ncbi:MAG: hypothetical protein GWM92_21565, partial [Gemmatimonadetes bacterium]|nr:hypothetical protein [Gemmatimonadota bacterium]NIR81441.1 hypothetical protein [Gemmatimonadota bacterium]NIT90280.1 hypothetical protein [Gemmatimonadota bacterium]NIU34106.1 hypothetical protein [Gemmatimonadota bacterium]NIU38263.1 hypothetical protein [Gemmatimonadota bacterium]
MLETRQHGRTGIILALLLLPAALGAQDTPQEKLEEALSAAPATIADAATVVDWEGNVLREGSNGWTCLPRIPGSTGPNPMCMDGPWMEWVGAFQEQTEPHVSGLGVAYMLAGDADVNNADPFDQT